MRVKEKRQTSNYETKDEKKKRTSGSGVCKRQGQEVEGRMRSSDVLVGWV